MLAPTLNSRTIRSVMISRCSSPIPRMIVWPVSWSVWTLKVGSSCMSFARAMPSFSWSALVLGSIATAMTGSGKFIASRMTGWSLSQIVSPVETLRRPTAAAMSPAQTSLISSRLLACILSSRPTRSLVPLVELKHGGAGVEVARVDPEERELADEGVRHDLEDQRGEGRVVVGLAARARRRRRRVRRSGARRAARGGSRRPRRAAAGRPCS